MVKTKLSVLHNFCYYYVQIPKQLNMNLKWDAAVNIVFKKIHANHTWTNLL